MVDESGVLRDLSALVDDIDAHLLADPARIAALSELVARTAPPALDPGLRIGPPITRPGKVVGIGLNYRDHAAEAGAAIPDQPVVFLKPASTIVGPHDDIVLPRESLATDHEVELGVVVGRALRRCDDPAEALASVAGYVAANDVTERSLAAGEPTWAKAKSADTFLPIGPWLVTPEEIPDPQALSLELWVDGDLRQTSSTAAMAVGVADLLCYLSGLMTLEPGDLVLTGTPGGVALGKPEPKPYLRKGQVVELEVQGLGRQRTPVTA